MDSLSRTVWSAFGVRSGAIAITSNQEGFASHKKATAAAPLLDSPTTTVLYSLCVLASKEIESFNIPNIIVKYHDTRAIS